MKSKTLGDVKPGITKFLKNKNDAMLPAGSKAEIEVLCKKCGIFFIKIVNNISRSPHTDQMHHLCRISVAQKLVDVKPLIRKYLQNEADGTLSAASPKKINVACKKCSKVINAAVSNFARSKNKYPLCALCANSDRFIGSGVAGKTLKDIKPNIKLVNEEDFNLKAGANRKVLLAICTMCSKQFRTNPAAIRSDGACKNCSMIKGRRRLIDVKPLAVEQLIDKSQGLLTEKSNQDIWFICRGQCSKHPIKSKPAYINEFGFCNKCATHHHFGTSPSSVKVEVVTECLRAGMSDTELHLFLPALGLKADARAVRTRFKQGLDIADAVHESTVDDGDEELNADESAALLNDPVSDADDEPSPEDKLQRDLNGMDAIQNAIDKTTALHRDRLAPVVETIVTTRVNSFWQTIFDAEYDGLSVAPIVRKVKTMEPNSQIAKDVQQRFLEEFAEVTKIKAPRLYRGYPLRLMQRRIMHLLAHRPYLGNWSGTGSGKTIAALCSALYINSELSVVICPNPVKTTWLAEIKNVFGNRVKVDAPESGDDWTATTGRILVLNYECFQQKYSESKVDDLLAGRGHEIGLFILDECHYAKMNENDPKESERRKTITRFMNGVSSAKRLAMSATPVVNNLSEAKRLIETLIGEAPEVQTRPTVANCITMYQELVKYGIRWRSEYKEIKVLKPEIISGAVVGPTVINIDAGKDLHANLLAEKKRLGKAFTPLVIDQMTLQFKLKAIIASVAKDEKAIVYTEYKEGIVDVIVNAFKKNGYKVAAFDGDTSEEDRASALNGFKGSEVNIIVATSAITTGIDGLQHCRKMVIASLPFTHARFTQLLGRIVRPTPDRAPRTVEIVLPLVTTKDWSGDVIRFKRISSKGSISASAIDGTVPTFDDSSRRELERSIIKALEEQT